MRRDITLQGRGDRGTEYRIFAVSCPDSSRDMGKCLMETVSRAVRAAVPGYLRDFSYDRGSGTQDRTDSRAAGAHFAEMLCASVQYAVLTRCGLDAADYLDNKSFAWITAFSEPAAMHQSLEVHREELARL